MVAGRLRRAGLAQLGLMCAWGAGWWWAGRPVLAVSGVLIVALFQPLVLAFEFLLLRRVNRADTAPPARADELLRAWGRECLVNWQVFTWRQAWCVAAQADHLPHAADAAGLRGVVLVHGFFCNRALWNPWMQALRERGVPFVAVTLEPAFGGIDEYPAHIDAAVQRVQAATGQAPLLVGHSMGGLAIRAWLRQGGAAARVHAVITLGTPHHGTWLARFALAPNARQMRQASPWLSTLRQAEVVPRGVPYTCFYSHCDNIVFPASTATLADADNRHLRATAHVDMINHPEVMAQVWLSLVRG